MNRSVPGERLPVAALTSLLNRSRPRSRHE
jgi:hypothetical protein